MVCFLDFCRSSTSAVAVCISTCSSEASKVLVVDTGSVIVYTVSLGLSGNWLMQRLL